MLWGDRVAVLKQFEKQHKRTPQALLDKPDMPWYYKDIFDYYMLLSNNRTRQVITTYKVIRNKTVPVNKLMPNRIDTNSILLLAQTTGIMSPVDFLKLVSELDTMFIKKAVEQING